MDEKKKYVMTLVDGTKFEGTGDGCGNMIIGKTVTEDKFTIENLREVTVVEGNYEYKIVDQILRLYTPYGTDSVMIKIDNMTDVEKIEYDYKAKVADLEATNAMLQDCVLEMSEIVYA